MLFAEVGLNALRVKPQMRSRGSRMSGDAEAGGEIQRVSRRRTEL